MKTLADVKRKMMLGSKWSLERTRNGQTEDVGVREIGLVQKNAVAFKSGGSELSWLYWPKAKNIVIHDEKSFSVTGTGMFELRYTLVK